ncbi:hypothetical protein OW701_08015 [Acinetobacter baumannii]|uniref:hypothetical protein n=1 Tax=Acinetobacter baumannii TaxID=470 RepID=UPI0024DEE5C5|nr:hypothetical protein [Acinetobacter baumannii]MDK2185417.1 hypothetical protein [Acinetobacter baumannii]MDK2258226.1 hypothetical protein [Acinetobacter baumannii]MDK2265700.1 hypothetical protein [Acinetobacter baumannii]MDK2273001.1 hypothetical protein [Acinetobacter baumannii]MDK2287496.1 hypothetical protein [Acinetobacter baumannii]
MDDLDYSAPSYVHKDSDRVSVFIASVIGFLGLFFVLRKIYLTGFSDIMIDFNFETIVLLVVLVGWFFMMLSGLSSVFPIYIDNHGGHYRTLFLRKRNLKWEDVNNIAILKGKKGNKFKYNTIVCSRDPSKLVWSISVSEDDSYEELYKVIDYYVHKYEIEVTLESTLDGSVQRLDGMPKKLDFS